MVRRLGVTRVGVCSDWSRLYVGTMAWKRVRQKE